MMSNEVLWKKATDSIAGKMSRRNFELWIKPLEFVSQGGDDLTLRAPNRYLKEWFEDNYKQLLEKEIQRSSGRALRIEVIVEDFEDLPEPARADIGSTSPAPVEAPRRRRLNDRYRFDTFVVGPRNQFAQAASALVSEMPGTKYNPLFIYGGTGLGKTHLLQAIGHAILDRHPSWNVIFLGAERFVNEYITSVRQNKMESLRDRYRNRCDVLLVDDIQFLAGKDRSQHEFFHTFNALHERHRQIVITSDKFPNEMPDLEDRLKSRFQWGLIVDILAPELETRVAILRKKAELDNIDLPEDVAQFLAQRIRSNVRELEGSLIRLTAFASLQGRPITVEFAEQILCNMLSRATDQVTVEGIQREVASYFNIKVSDLKSSRRPRAISYPRQIAMHLCRKLTPESLTEIGRKFGGKDHTTVLSADRKIRRLRDEEDGTRQAVEMLIRRLKR